MDAILILGPNDPFIIRIEDLREKNICTFGAYAWFKYHKLDWHDFVHNGISSDVLLKIGDPMAVRAVELARVKYNTRV